MGSPFSPVVQIISFKKLNKVLQSTTLKPVYFYRYVDDTLVVWLHSQDSKVFEYLSSRNYNIKFSIDIGKDDIWLSRHDASLTKPRSQCIQEDDTYSFHRLCVVNTLPQKEITISDDESLQHLQTTLQ